MRKFTLLATLLFAAPVAAGEVRNVITDSVQLTVSGPSLQTTRMGGSYSVSGSGLTIGNNGIGGWNGDDNTNGTPDFSTGQFTATTAGGDFSFSQSINYADAIVTDQNALATDGQADESVLYGNSTQFQGGTKGSLAGTLSVSGPATITAGGAGTTAIGQRVIELSVFE